jgi:twitching motility protein PilT
VNQRELGFDTLSYHQALRNVVRQDPDVILVGEMRDLETMAAALTAAQTGHLVLSTIHTIDAIQTVSRVVDLFPPYQQSQIRYQLADTLKAVVCQRLLAHFSGSGRVPAVEVLINTPLVKKYIEENNLAEINNLMKQGSFYGMQTFNQSLLHLYETKEIKLEDALSAASNPEELMLTIRGIESGTSSREIIDRSF